MTQLPGADSACSEQGVCAWADADCPASLLLECPRVAAWALPHADSMSPPVFVQTPVLEFQSRFAAPFLTCIQTQPAKTCPDAFCWI